ncbi:hypothetical protein OJF2_47570 [Aquisphaera giovannonii]|uniref:Uncharacterized protein n=1 Tax=Aquisphaera giovannonii TaxID=406548 RepID=A0A5B9W766_9BACT|nr:hypothetical protein [Aquisphaera giovannonii]QEH36197.1 hypothetical protein OJF2_47570 [Aquisphaera giovannonii]
MEAEHCPACGKTLSMLGVARTLGEAAASQFVPNYVRSLRSWRDGVTLREGARFRCCLSCGHVWANLKPEELRAFIVAHGDELAKQALARGDAEAWYDLPDHPEARRAAEAVGEIDALFLAEKTAEAVRRFRELSGRTWDEAIEATRNWRAKRRAEKLALFGWQSKSPSGDVGERWAVHPLHDPLLDG